MTGYDERIVSVLREDNNERIAGGDNMRGYSERLL